MTTPPQLDLTEHVFRSVRGWLHRLYPDDHILIERRADASMKEGQPTSPDRPVWNLVLADGPNWAEHTGGSSMVSYVFKIIRGADSLWDAQRTAGALVANAARPGGRIPLRGYNLVWPAQPNIRAGATATTGWTSELVDIAVALLDADGLASAPSVPVTVKVTDGTPLLIEGSSWPYGRPTYRVFAAEHGEALQAQGDLTVGDIFVLDAVADGSTPASNVSCDLLGLRVTSAGSDSTQLTTEGTTDFHQAVVQLGLTVQVPRVLGAHLDAALVP